MAYNKNNVFAKIIRKELPCKKIYENNNALSFFDINPRAKTHVLVIPKGEYEDLLDFTNNATPEEILDFTNAISETAKELDISSNFKVISNIGKDAGQEVFHFHLHIMKS